VTRAEFQELADLRLAEARTLLVEGQWDGAYYLAGYAVELGLKACIIKTLLNTDAFPEQEFSKKCYTHAVETLVWLANLEDARRADMSVDSNLEANWALAATWSEQKRHHRIDRNEAEALFEAIADPLHGVLPWTKMHW
jgi:HEPN domain